MIGPIQPSVLAAVSVFAAISLATAGATLRWIRLDGSDVRLSGGKSAADVVGIATLSAVAVSLLRLAVSLVVGEGDSGSGWGWLIRTESVAIAGFLLLVFFVDSSDRVRLLLGSTAAAALTWASGEWPPLAGAISNLDPVGPPLMAGILCSILLSPGPTARLVTRVRDTALGSSENHILLVDETGKLLHADGAARESLGLPARSLWPFSRVEPLPPALRELLDDPEHKKNRLQTRSGRVLEAQTTELTQRTPLSRARGILMRDVTSEYLDERRLVRLAHYDSLTGLANRRLFLESLGKILVAGAERSQRAALFYIDLDHFKSINDSLGHAAGDALLKTLADRFRSRLKPQAVAQFGISADAKLVVARLAGDEFAVIAPDVPDGAVAGELARWILEAISRPIELSDQIIKPSASVGVALFPEDGQEVDTLLRHADSALYVAKSRGRKRYARYEASFDAKAERARVLEEGLRHALDRGEMRLHYQPKLDVCSGRLVGFEALVRWCSAELGDVGPAEFIPVAETRGLVTRLGTWCINEVCRQVRMWRDEGYEVVPIAVNVSPVQFAESDLQRVVSDALKNHGVDPHSLELELTESLLLDEGNHVETVLRDLRSIGVRIALDDFGTGYSALSYLNRFQLDVLKIDRGLLRDIDGNPSALGVASAVVAMAHSLDLIVVAEGVDTVEQLPLLRDVSCDHVQGFVFSPALPAFDVERFLHRTGEEPHAFEPGMMAPGSRTDDKVAEEIAGLSGVHDPVLEGPGESLGGRPRKGSAEQGRVLLIDDGRGSLGTLSLRLMRLGIDSHYSASVEEAVLYVEQEKEAIHVFIIPPTVDIEAANRVQDALAQITEERRRVIVIGERPDEEERVRIRDAGVDWVLWAPYNDSEIRYVVKSAMTMRRDLIDRRDIRVPVDLVANIWSGSRREVAVVSSLSPRGAFIELSEPLALGSSLRIEMELPGDRFRGFARVVSVVRDDPGRPESPSGMSVTFYGIDRNAEVVLKKAISELEARYVP